MSKYTTGDMAKLCNVSVRTVQFYDTKGILHPSELTEGGRRLYTNSDLTQLQLICTLKTIGLSLDSIKGILGSDSSTKVLSLLLDEHVKQLDNEIAQRQNQLAAIAAIKENLRDKATIPVNSIVGIERVMKNNKMVRKRLRKLIVVAGILSIPTYTLLALWIFGNLPWWPFMLYFVGMIPVGILLAYIHFKDAAFICAECNATFKPPFGMVLRTSGTPKARWLTCTACGHAGYCVETYVGDETL